MNRYFTIFILLLVTEIAIAVFKFHDFIRGFVGDVLVIPLLYVLLRASTPLSKKRGVFLVLGFAFFVEFLQLFAIAEKLHIQNPVAQIIIGSTFDPWDLVAYVLGILPIVFIEKLRTYGTP